MKALSIRQPWAWLIVNGYKDVENRTWPTNVRGTVLIHAAKGMTEREYYDALGWIMHKPAIAHAAPLMPRPHELERGGIVGMATIWNCVQDDPSPWFTGPHGFVLRHANRLTFIPMKGSLGFFEAGTLPGVVDRDDNTQDMFRDQA